MQITRNWRKSSYKDWQQNKQTHWFSAEMPFVSGFVVPKMNSTSHVGNIRLLRPVVVSIERNEDNQVEYDYTKDAEEPEEILHWRSSERISLTSRKEAKLLHALWLCTRKNLPYLSESAQLSDNEHNKGWKINFWTVYLPAYLPDTQIRVTQKKAYNRYP